MRRAELVASVAGCLLVVAALVIIWAARLSIPRALYVSELGAEGMPTARNRSSARARASRRPSPRFRRSTSSIWKPTVKAGFSEAIRAELHEIGVAVNEIAVFTVNLVGILDDRLPGFAFFILTRFRSRQIA